MAKRALDSDDGSERAAKRHRGDESLGLGRHLFQIVRAANAASQKWRHLTDPTSIRGAFGKVVRSFVADVCAEEPLATFARMCLAPGDPVAPNSEEMARIRQLSDDDFKRIWDRIDQSKFLDAKQVVRSVFLRGAVRVCAALPPRWRPHHIVCSGGHRFVDDNLRWADAERLSCDEIILFAGPGRHGATLFCKPLGGAATFVRTALSAKGVVEWAAPRNAGAAQKLADVVERFFGHIYFRRPDEVGDSGGRVLDMVSTQRTLFSEAVPSIPAIARAVSSLAPPDEFREGLGRAFCAPGLPNKADLIFACLERGRAAVL